MKDKLSYLTKEGYAGQRISFFILCINTKGDGRKFHDQTKGVFVCVINLQTNNNKDLIV